VTTTTVGLRSPSLPPNQAAGRPLAAVLADVVALGKPRIAAMAAIVGGGTFCLSSPSLSWSVFSRGLLGLAGVALIVMGAGALNMILERDVDRLMERTRDRPLAARRLSSGIAVATALSLCLLAVALLWRMGNVLSLGLGLFGLFVYVLVYTPMKRTSPWSLVVGAVPGALPALMGGTLAAGVVDRAGVAMFGLVFLWQLPHFLAISLYREREYGAAGHKLFPAVLGVRATQGWIVATSALLVTLGIALAPLGLGSGVTVVVAVGVGLWFLVRCTRGLRLRARVEIDAWARSVFFGTLVWQTAVFGALAVDRALALWGR
jgi:protoheme IX farnesyltransferase